MKIKIINTLYIGFILKLNYDSNIKCNEDSVKFRMKK